MQRLYLASLLVVTLIVSGCESGTSTGPVALAFVPSTSSGQGFVALYAPPPFDVLPYPNDIYNPVAAGTGSTLAIPARATTPLAEALNTLDGFSTVAKITAPFNAVIDQATLIPFNILAPTGTETVFVLDGTNGVPLIPGVDYSVGVSSSAGADGAVLEITPLRPLAPQTTYVFILTSGIQSTAGVAAGADTSFGAVRDAHLAGLTSVPGAPELDPLFPAITPLIDTAVGVFGLAGDSVVVAWSATTQSISDVLDTIQASATSMAHELLSMGITTGDLGLGLPGIADLYHGWLEIPYYQDPADVLGSVWVNSDLVPPTAANATPVPQGGTLRIPMLASLPNAGSGQMEPMDGWPVVLLMHGVTRNRTIMVTLADAFAQAGFALVAIDLPIHGVTDTTSIFYQGPGHPLGDNERHFNLDNVGPLGDLVPDGEIDDGWQIFNVSNPLNGRDHGRQAVSDLIHLVRTSPMLDFDGDDLPDTDGDRIHFMSVSLGSIFSTAFVALNTEFSTATMSSVGGPFSAFLFDPMATTFGAPIVAGIEAAGAPFGSVSFDNFARDLQTVIDPIDPMNFGAAAAGNHPIHVVGSVLDTSVPMTLINNVADVMGLSDISTTTVDAGGVRGIVRFLEGGHGAIFNPLDNLAVTTEMQTQAVTFAVTGGTTILITNSSIVQ